MDNKKELLLAFWKPIDQVIVKLTIHRNGNMGFSKPAVKRLGVDKTSYVKIGEDINNNLYLVVTNEADPYGFKVCRAGEYHYLNTQKLLRAKGFDYLTKKIIYDIVELEDKNLYKLVKREIERKVKK